MVSARDFLNTTGEEASGIPLVNADNPIAWGRLAKAFLGALIALIYGGIFGVLRGVFRFFGGPFEALASFGVDVVNTITTTVTTVMSETVAISIAALSPLPAPLRLPAAAAVLLMGLYVANRGVSRITGGGD